MIQSVSDLQLSQQIALQFRHAYSLAQVCLHVGQTMGKSPITVVGSLLII